MTKSSTAEPTLHDLFEADPLEDALRGGIRAIIETVLEEELTACLRGRGIRPGADPRGG